jgi:hypothetical protein
MPFWPPLLLADKPTSIKHRGQYNYIDFYINLLNLTNPFDSGLEKMNVQGRPPLGRHGIIKSTPLEGLVAPSPWWWCLLVVCVVVDGLVMSQDHCM